MGERGGDSPPQPPGSGENQAGGPGGNGIWGPRRRKIGWIWGPTVGRWSGGKIKMFIPTVYKRIFMNFMVEFAKNRSNLYRLNSIYYCFSLEKLNLD